MDESPPLSTQNSPRIPFADAFVWLNNVRQKIKEIPPDMSNEPKMSSANVGDQKYLVGFTPVDPILFVNKDTPNADITGVKYSKHLYGDKRPIDAEADKDTRITMLIAGGPWRQEMWTSTTERTVHILRSPGDYIAWEPGYCHTWEALGDATMLTVSFRRREELLEAEQAASSNH